MLVPVLLSGGSGSRLWPASRRFFPKQFIKILDSKKSLFQMTLERIETLKVDKTGWIIVTNNDHKFLVEDQLDEINPSVNSIFLEPFGNNTAPAIALAAIQALEISKNAKLLVQTADHIIPDTKYFCDLVANAIKSEQPLITFGVSPTEPHTGYGYINIGKEIGKTGTFKVEQFIEKPNLEKAKFFSTNDKYLWNAGIFLLDATEYLNELKRLNPDIISTCYTSFKNAVIDKPFIKINHYDFKECPSISIDYAVMEKSKKVSVIPFKSKWSDLGSWDTVFNDTKPDLNNNAIIGNGLVHDTFNTLIYSDKRLVTALGVNDLIIAETSDAILVTSKKSSQNVKEVVNILKKSKTPEVNEHTLCYRPWGNYETILHENNYKVKKILVKPGKSLSLQSHQHRSEHWVIVEGVAEVINGKDILLLNENESTFIPKGNKHRLTNPKSTNLILIETQLGSYLEEDDIIRYKDDFGRL